MYSGSLNATTGSPVVKRRKVPRRPSAKELRISETAEPLGPLGYIRAVAGITLHHLRNFVLGISDQYDQEVEDPDAGEQRYAPPSLEHLQKSTRFTRKEIKSIYVSFKQECPTGTVTPEKFRELVAQFFPLGDATVFCRLLFQLLDHDADEFVTFEQFLCSMSVMFRGSLEEKLRWTFNLYDLDGDGYLSVQEIMHVGKAVFDLLGKHTEPPIQEDSIEAHIVRVYAKMDVDGDGIVTFDQFKHACINDGAVIENLFVFNF